MAYLFKQLVERSCDLRPGERFRDQQDSSGTPGTEARVSLLRCVTDDYDGKLGVIRVVTHGVEERLAHVEGGTVEHERIGSLLQNQLVDGVDISRCEDLVAEITKRKGQKLGNLRRVVDEQDAAQSVRYFLPAPAPGSRFFLPSEGSRSRTHTRPPAV